MEIEMKKFAFICAAVVTLAVPSVVSAQGVSVHVGDDGYYRDRGDYRGHYREYRGARAEYYGDHDRGWHRGWEHRGDRVTIIKRHRHDWDD
jgi:hypothetical protein